ncbi:MAG: efflux RND transporter periplasmic adaptor subunit [Acidaminobacteraceae bacterium]
MNKKKIIIIAVIGAVIIGGAFTLMPKKANLSVDASETSLSKEYKVPVSVEKPTTTDMARYVYSIGDISSDDIYTVTPKIQGEVESINFKVGDSVKKNDVLFKIKNSDFLVDKNANISQLKNQLETSKFAYDDALTSYNNTKLLYEAGSSSKREFDASSTQYENAKNNYNSTLENYNNRINTYKSSGDNYLVKSPSNGIVTKINMSVGMNVSSQNSFEIESSSRKIFNTSIATTDISAIEVGQLANIYISTIDMTIDGSVREISYSGVNGSFPVTIELDDKEDVFTGMYGEVKIAVEQRNEVLSINEKSIMVEGDSKFVYTITNNVASKKEIKTGIKDQSMVEVISGLSADNDVVVLGKEYLNDGSDVVISE